MHESIKRNTNFVAKRVNWKTGTPVDIQTEKGATCNFDKTITPVLLGHVIVRCCGGEDKGKMRVFSVSNLSASK
jgi:hypothetical protein